MRLRRSPRCRGSRCSHGPSPLHAAAAVLGGAGRRRRGLDQARGPAAAGVRREQAAEPRVPRRRGAGRGRRHARHVGPALVEPLPAHGRGGREGRSRRPSRPHRPAASTRRGGPNQRLDELLGATVHVTATDERAERAALVDRVAADLRGGGRRPFVDRASAGPGRSGRPARSSRPRGVRSGAARPGSSRPRSSCPRRPAGPTPACSSDRGSPARRRRGSSGSRSPRHRRSSARRSRRC